MVSIAIPVGPRHPEHCRYLSEAIQSIVAQSVMPSEVIFIDDMHGLDEHGCLRDIQPQGYPFPVRAWRSPWHLGVAHAFNFGVALSADEIVLQMGADDTIGPDVIAAIDSTWEAHDRAKGWYWLPVRYMDTGEMQYLPCHAAAATKRLWDYTGGLPPETASGASDAAFISMMLVHHPELLIEVTGAVYHYRRHEDTDTASRGPWQGVILETRDILTRDWKPAAGQWGRYA